MAKKTVEQLLDASEKKPRRKKEYDENGDVLTAQYMSCPFPCEDRARWLGMNNEERKVAIDVYNFLLENGPHNHINLSFRSGHDTCLVYSICRDPVFRWNLVEREFAVTNLKDRGGAGFEVHNEIHTCKEWLVSLKNKHPEPEKVIKIK